MKLRNLSFVHGEHRRHEEVGPVKIFEVRPRGTGRFVAVELDHHGQPVDVFDVHSLDHMGWSAVRLPHNSLTSEDRQRACSLKAAGKSAREIAEELAISRATAQRITKGIVKGISSRAPQRYLSEIEHLRIKRLRNRGWRIQTIAHLLEVSHETVRRIVKKEEGKTDV